MIQSDPDPTLRGHEKGQRVFGRYVLDRVVGRGGMGVVWRARDETLGEDIALKFLPEAIRWDAGAVEELKEETRRARQLTHPNIVRIHDFIADGSAAAISMELVDGRTLADLRLAKPRRVFTPEEIIAWLPQACAALDYAHAQAHVVHRDLKPANIMLTAAGVVKIADFGVARSLLDATSRLSNASSGTLCYMSPEQAMGDKASPSDDIYSLGATLYELLTGKPPFYSGDVRAQLLKRVPDRMSVVRGALGIAEPLPGQWERVVAACLAKRAGDRPASGGELLDRITGPKAGARDRPRRARAIPIAAGLALAAAAIGGVLAVHRPEPAGTSGGIAASTLRPQAAKPQPFTDFVDDFNSGFGGWYLWGEPRPQRIRTFQGRRWIFDNNGDDMYLSGMTSLARFTAPGGFVLESDVFLNVTNPGGGISEACVGLTRDPDRWMNAFGSAGDGGDGVKVGLIFAGDGAWATPLDMRRHTWLEASYLGENGQKVVMVDSLPREASQADRLANRWVTLRIEVGGDRHIRFLADGKAVWAPTEKISPALLQGQRIVLSGHSLGSPGKAYHDWVRFHALGANGLRQDRSEPPTPLGETLLWRDSDWQAPAGSAAAAELLRGATPDGTLSLTSGGSDIDAVLQSRRVLRDQIAVFFEAQPLLQSHPGSEDRAWLGLVAAGGGGNARFVGIELAGGTAWFIDTARPGDARRIGRMGTYSPGSWQAFSLHIDGPNTLEAVGSLMEDFSYDLGTLPPGGWRVEVAVHDSSDGVALRPVRAAGLP